MRRRPADRFDITRLRRGSRYYAVDVHVCCLVDELATEVNGSTVEITRSAHGSDVLVQELTAAGANVHETQLYRLNRPTAAGSSVTLATDGQLDAILFTSPRAVEHFCEIAAEQDGVPALQRGVAETVIGAIGMPTAQAIQEHGITVDVIPDTVGFTQLADCTMEELTTRH